MLESLTPHFPGINVLLNVVNILILLGIVKPFLHRKSRMKKKIKDKLSEGYNRGEFLLPEIQIRDDLLSLRALPLFRFFFLKNSYILFMDSIRELEKEEEIERVSNLELEYTINREVEEKYPSYPSRAKKKPEDYGLKKDDPQFYLGLSTQNVKALIANLKQKNTIQSTQKMERPGTSVRIITPRSDL